MATLDVLTLAEALAVLKGLGNVGDHAKVERLVTAVSKRLDEECGPIVKRSVEEIHMDVGWGLIFLNGKPFTGGTFSVTEAWSNETPVAVASTDYVVEAGPTGAVRRWSAGWASRVTVTYEAGRYADTASVAAHFKYAAGELLKQLWRPTEGGGSETFGPPAVFFPGANDPFDAVRPMLAGELLPSAIV